MAYTIEKARNPNLEDTSIPNLFITDFMPDAPDGDFVKVYIYAYMCCCHGEALTHTELAGRLGIESTKVVSAWKYFAERRIVRLIPQMHGGESHFDVEFIDVKGVLYGGDKSQDNGKSGKEPGPLADPAMAVLFQRLAVICKAPSIDGGDAQRIIGWVKDYGATPEIIEFAYVFCCEERGTISINYVEKIVKEWAEHGLKNTSDVREYRARIDARSAVHKKLKDALGMRYNSITVAEEKLFNLWLDDYEYTPERLLELAERTAGIGGNRMNYLKGIIRKEREAEGKEAEKSPAGGSSPGNSQKDRVEHYRKRRLKNEKAAIARQEEIYASVPEVKQIDEEIAMLNMELVKTLTSGMTRKQSAMARLDSEINAAAERRKELLIKAGFAPDYTEKRYDCMRCMDTGSLENGASCDCFPIGKKPVERKQAE